MDEWTDCSVRWMNEQIVQLDGWMNEWTDCSVRWMNGQTVQLDG